MGQCSILHRMSKELENINSDSGFVSLGLAEANWFAFNVQ